MAKFGLACEGITDQIVIENILCGFYKNPDLDDDIQAFQPAYDETTKKQKEGEFGGWEMLLEYLSQKRFKDDVLNSEYVIIQIDTDISDEVGFDVFKNGLSVGELIVKVIERLVQQINIIFYEMHKEKILFAISVHSLECWLLPIYNKINKNEKLTGCYESLQRESKKIIVNKDYKTYDKLSKDFLKYKELMKIVSKNSSLKIFIESLSPKI